MDAADRLGDASVRRISASIVAEAVCTGSMKLGLPVPIRIGWRALEVLSVLIDHRGTIVSRKQIIDAVWPGAVVEENNLTIQISALRRVLDRGDLEKSCIQTVPGRGYRFIGSVTRSNRRCPRRIPVASAPGGQFAPSTVLPDLGIASAPRLSVVVLPFSNLGGTRDEDYLADAITDDLTTDLSRLPGALVIAHHSAATYKGKPVDIRQVGEELGVRYVVEGSVRKLDSLLRVNARLIAAETNTHVWADRFDHCAEDRTLGQEEIASRLRSALGLQVLNAESVRSIRERPDSPDASDLLLRAWSTWCNPPGPGSLAQAAALFEQALQLDASLVPAMCGLADVLINQVHDSGFAGLGQRNPARTRGRSAFHRGGDRTGQRTIPVLSGVPVAGAGAPRGSKRRTATRHRAAPERLRRIPPARLLQDSARPDGGGSASARTVHSARPALAQQSVRLFVDGLFAAAARARRSGAALAAACTGGRQHGSPRLGVPGATFIWPARMRWSAICRRRGERWGRPIDSGHLPRSAVYRLQSVARVDCPIPFSEHRSSA